jgi:hypothetical protein
MNWILWLLLSSVAIQSVLTFALGVSWHFALLCVALSVIVQLDLRTGRQ